jgi:hypothetical protein
MTDAAAAKACYRPAPFYFWQPLDRFFDRHPRECPKSKRRYPHCSPKVLFPSRPRHHALCLPEIIFFSKSPMDLHPPPKFLVYEYENYYASIPRATQPRRCCPLVLLPNPFCRYNYQKSHCHLFSTLRD